ncbi:hypothetical protein PDQ31_26600 [Bacillus cereus]|nr:hypothetical protein [Bacillus cereus]
MIQTIILKSNNTNVLQEKVNEALKGLIDTNIVDIKLSTSSEGYYVAMIIYSAL